MLHLCYRLTLIEALIYGSIISATDPVRCPAPGAAIRKRRGGISPRHKPSRSTYDWS